MTNVWKKKIWRNSKNYFHGSIYIWAREKTKQDKIREILIVHFYAFEGKIDYCRWHGRMRIIWKRRVGTTRQTYRTLPRLNFYWSRGRRARQTRLNISAAVYPSRRVSRLHGNIITLEERVTSSFTIEDIFEDIFLPFRYFIDHSFAKNFFEISERFSFEEQQGWPRYWLYRGQDFDIRLLSRMIFVLTRVTTETQVAVNGVVFYFGQSAGYIAAESVDQGSQLDNGSFEIWLWVTRLFFSSFFSLANPVLSPCFNFYPYLIFFFFFFARSKIIFCHDFDHKIETNVIIYTRYAQIVLIRLQLSIRKLRISNSASSLVFYWVTLHGDIIVTRCRISKTGKTFTYSVFVCIRFCL